MARRNQLECKEVERPEMDLEKVERARQLLNVLEMRQPKGKTESLIRLLCVQELNRDQRQVA